MGLDSCYTSRLNIVKHTVWDWCTSICPSVCPIVCRILVASIEQRRRQCLDAASVRFSPFCDGSTYIRPCDAYRGVPAVLGSVLHAEHCQRRLPALRPVRSAGRLSHRPRPNYPPLPLPISFPFSLFHLRLVCRIDPVLLSFFVWLGYINSFLNPVIFQTTMPRASPKGTGCCSGFPISVLF